MPNHIIEEFMRGSVVEFQQTNPREPKYLSWFKDIVWGTTTDDDSRDYLQIGKFGCRGYVPLHSIQGVEITEKIIEDYGFLNIKKSQDCITYYRDDFGYVKLDTYGIEHVYMKGKCIKYLHNFQRIFLDYTGRLLYPKPSQPPKQDFKATLIKIDTTDEMLQRISEAKKINTVDIASVSFELKF